MTTIQIPTSISRLQVFRLLLNHVVVGYRFIVMSNGVEHPYDLRVEDVRTGVYKVLEKQNLPALNVYERNGYFVDTVGRTGLNSLQPNVEYTSVKDAVANYIMHFGGNLSMIQPMDRSHLANSDKGHNVYIGLQTVHVVKGTSMRHAQIVIQSHTVDEVYRLTDILGEESRYLRIHPAGTSADGVTVIGEVSLATLLKVIVKYGYILSVGADLAITKPDGTHVVSNLLWSKDIKHEGYEPLGGFTAWKNKLDALRLTGSLVYIARL